MVAKMKDMIKITNDGAVGRIFFSLQELLSLRFKRLN